MGRVIVVLLFAVLVVPALLLWRIWRQAGQRRLVNEATLGFLTPTVQAERTLSRWPVRARAVRAAGLVAGLVGPPLDGVGERLYIAGMLPNTVANMTRFIADPRAVNPQTMMPDVGASDADARLMATYLYSVR